MKWRREVIVHVFGEEPSEQLLEANRRYYEKSLKEGNHTALVALEDGHEYGCGGICYSEELPSPDNETGRCGYLMNIYVREPYRHLGVAHHIVRLLIEEAQSRGCGKIYLETTQEGKPVYESIGFRDMQDMMKYYGAENKNRKS